jgi:hypothetical protein
VDAGLLTAPFPFAPKKAGKGAVKACRRRLGVLGSRNSGPIRPLGVTLSICGINMWQAALDISAGDSEAERQSHIKYGGAELGTLRISLDYLQQL